MSKFKILLTLIAVSFQEDPISNIIVTREKYLEYKSDVVDGALDPKVGHGISPNYSPRFSPPLHTEHVPGISDIFKMTGLTSSDDHVPLPNTWQTIPNYRYPYYDSSGRGYLLYGYGKGDLYNYSEFEAMEGYF